MTWDECAREWVASHHMAPVRLHGRMNTLASCLTMPSVRLGVGGRAASEVFMREIEEMADDSEALYAPLIERHVPCPTLEVMLLKGSKPTPAYDARGRPLVVAREADLSDLAASVTEPGCYRVLARHPKSHAYITEKDHSVTPAMLGKGAAHAGPRVLAQAAPVHAAPAHSTPYAAVSEHAYVGHLHQTINDLKDALREATSRADRDIRYERERADAGIKAAQEKCEAAVKAASDANIKLAAYGARLDGSQRRCTELEDQLEVLRSEVEAARLMAAELKQKAEEGEFSPVDAFMQVDQAFDLIDKTANRFKN